MIFSGLKPAYKCKCHCQMAIKHVCVWKKGHDKEMKNEELRRIRKESFVSVAACVCVCACKVRPHTQQLIIMQTVYLCTPLPPSVFLTQVSTFTDTHITKVSECACENTHSHTHLQRVNGQRILAENLPRFNHSLSHTHTHLLIRTHIGEHTHPHWHQHLQLGPVEVHHSNEQLPHAPVSGIIFLVEHFGNLFSRSGKSQVQLPANLEKSKQDNAVYTLSFAACSSVWVWPLMPHSLKYD